MKVLIYSHSFLPRVGGVEFYTDRLARYLSAVGVQAMVVTRSPAPEGDDADRKYRVVRGPAAPALDAIIAASDVLHCNGFHLGAFRSARRHGIPILWFHHDYDVLCPKSIGWNGHASCQFSLVSCLRCLARDHSATEVARRLASYALKRRCIGWARVHAVHTEYARKRMGLAGAAVLRCAADLGEDKEENKILGDTPNPARGCNPLDPAVSLLFAGRLIPEKGCDVLLRAMAKCRTAGVAVSAEVCGEGPERVRLEGMAAELGLGESVEFRGVASQEELARLMQQRVVVVPSVWDEVTGAVALEAMGRGCPVIASDVGGLGEMVRGVGLLFERGNAEELALRLISVAKDPTARVELSQRSFEAARTVYSWDLVAGNYLGVYREMVGGR